LLKISLVQKHNM